MWAWGSDGSHPTHDRIPLPPLSSSPTDVNLITAQAEEGPAPTPSKLLVAHGVVMAVAYALLMPAAGFAARYYGHKCFDRYYMPGRQAASQLHARCPH